jgi:hypothetical protein
MDARNWVWAKQLLADVIDLPAAEQHAYDPTLSLARNAVLRKRDRIPTSGNARIGALRARLGTPEPRRVARADERSCIRTVPRYASEGARRNPL